MLIFAWHVVKLLGDVRYVIYDFACGLLRVMRKAAHAAEGEPSHAAWSKLLSLRWVVDRLHYRGHRGCKDPASSWYEPDVNPDTREALRGVDSEACEQLFSVAGRCVSALGHAHAVTFELALLLFSDEHNDRVDCAKRLAKYRQAQASLATSNNSLRASPTEDDDGSLDACAGELRQRRKKARR